jgi:hypothetical protein
LDLNLRDFALHLTSRGDDMNQAEFVERMLALAKESFPELYAVNIDGRRAEFIQKHSPVSRKEEVELLGHVPEGLRVLWALATLLCKHYPPLLIHPSVATDPVGEIMNYQIVHFSAAVQLGFWDAVTENLQIARPTGVLALGDDWAVNRLLKPSKQDFREGEMKSYIATMVEFMIASRGLAERLKNS